MTFLKFNYFSKKLGKKKSRLSLRFKMKSKLKRKGQCLFIFPLPSMFNNSSKIIVRKRSTRVSISNNSKNFKNPRTILQLKNNNRHITMILCN